MVRESLGSPITQNLSQEHTLQLESHDHAVGRGGASAQDKERPQSYLCYRLMSTELHTSHHNKGRLWDPILANQFGHGLAKIHVLRRKEAETTRCCVFLASGTTR